MQPQSLQRAWKTKPWTRRLYGLTCDPSTVERGVASWILLLAASRAKTYPWRGGVPGFTVSDPASTSSCCASWTSAERRWSSLRTSQALFPTSEPSSVSLPREGSLRSGVCYLRPRLERPIDGSGGSVWATATSHERTHAPRAVDHGEQLANQVDTWPTPTSRDHKDGASPSEAVPTNGLLGRAAPRWQTPSVVDSSGRDYTYPGGDKTKPFPTLVGQAYRHSPQAPPTPMPGGGSSSGGPTSRLLSPIEEIHEMRRLNPNFVEWLMGWPIGWTACEPAVTASYHSRQQKPSVNSPDESGSRRS